MSKKHQKVLDAIFSDHLSGNMHWKEVESLLLYLGAELRESHGARVVVSVGDAELTLHRPHHASAMSKTDLHQLRHFITETGIGHLGDDQA